MNITVNYALAGTVLALAGFGQIHTPDPLISSFFSSPQWGWPFNTHFVQMAVSFIAAFFAVIAGSEMPDSIAPNFKKWTHTWSIVFPILFLSVLFTGLSFVTCYFVAYASHCILDAFTASGVPVFKPWVRVSFAGALGYNEDEGETLNHERRLAFIVYAVFALTIFLRWQGAFFWLN